MLLYNSPDKGSGGCIDISCRIHRADFEGVSANGQAGVSLWSGASHKGATIQTALEGGRFAARKDETGAGNVGG